MHYQLWFINNCSNISGTKYAGWILHPKLTGEAYYCYCYYYCSCCCWLGGRYGCWEWKQQLLINIHRRGREEKILVSSSAFSLYSLSLSVDFSLLLTLFSFDFLLYLYHNIFSHFLFLLSFSSLISLIRSFFFFLSSDTFIISFYLSLRLNVFTHSLIFVISLCRFLWVHSFTLFTSLSLFFSSSSNSFTLFSCYFSLCCHFAFVTTVLLTAWLMDRFLSQRKDMSCSLVCVHYIYQQKQGS